MKLAYQFIFGGRTREQNKPQNGYAYSQPYKPPDSAYFVEDIFDEVEKIFHIPIISLSKRRGKNEQAVVYFLTANPSLQSL